MPEPAGRLWTRREESPSVWEGGVCGVAWWWDAKPLWVMGAWNCGGNGVVWRRGPPSPFRAVLDSWTGELLWPVWGICAPFIKLVLALVLVLVRVRGRV
jgi:hypothetical protein